MRSEKSALHSLAEVRQALAEMADAHEKAVLLRFFKCAPGEYAEHDVFVGIKTPRLRALAARCMDLDLDAVTELLRDPVHEYRLLALVLMQQHYRRGAQEAVFTRYAALRAYVNNWDLVDISAPHLVGDYLLTRPRELLYQWAQASVMWERRIAIVATLAFVRAGEFQDSLRLAEMLLHDRHDLIHKACGWVLREVGKRDLALLCGFLDRHAPVMARTMLRYSIEKFSPELRQYYLTTTSISIKKNTA
jgi:3-methyladenine DNA glycosylase AlkD